MFMSPDLEQTILALLQQGKSLGEVATMVGKGKTSIHRVAVRHGFVNGASKAAKAERKGTERENAERPPERKQGSRWTEREKATALQAYVETASVEKTAAQTGIPARTIYRWLDEDPGWRAAAVQVSRVCARILEDRAEAIMVNLLHHAETGDGKDASLAVRGIDTLQKTLSFVKGGPTDRVETNKVTPEEWRRGRQEKPL